MPLSGVVWVKWENYGKVLHEHGQNTRSLLGYNLFYRQIDEATFEARNMSKYEGREACSKSDTWQVAPSVKVFFL